VKDFDSWNEIKKKTENEERRFYKVREIWWCRFGLNIGTEQNGKDKWFTRPCVILIGFGPDSCLVVPTTTSTREHRVRISIGKIEGKDAKANLSQIRIIDTRRLEKKIGFLDKDLFLILKKSARDLF
jgi:mRNA-degrading endonuclease toxin of MazEF toxin-antitoxin module